MGQAAVVPDEAGGTLGLDYVFGEEHLSLRVETEAVVVVHKVDFELKLGGRVVPGVCGGGCARPEVGFTKLHLGIFIRLRPFDRGFKGNRVDPGEAFNEGVAVDCQLLGTDDPQAIRSPLFEGHQRLCIFDKPPIAHHIGYVGTKVGTLVQEM